MEHLAGLSEQETAACVIAERSLGVRAEPWDLGRTPGVVDALLHYLDGRVAAFEVTAMAAEGALQTDNILKRDGFQWPLVGLWQWTISIGSPRDIPRLKLSYLRIIAACEAVGAQRPNQIGWDPDADEDLRWLVQESSSSMLGHSGLPARDFAMVTPEGRGGAVDHQLEGLLPSLAAEFSREYIVKHFEKLERAGRDERHLFIPLHMSALTNGVMLGLSFDNVDLPVADPPVPDTLSHLWLAPAYSRRVLLWTRDEGWRNHFPYG